MNDFIKNPQTRNALAFLPLNISAVGSVHCDISGIYVIPYYSLSMVHLSSFSGLTYVSYLRPDQTFGFYSCIAIKFKNVKNMKHMSTEFAESLKIVSRLNCVIEFRFN